MKIFQIEHEYISYSNANKTIIAANSKNEAKSLFDLNNLVRKLNIKIIRIEEINIDEPTIIDEFEC
jgi:hypothetical protein